MTVMKPVFFTALLIASSLIISCDEDDTEDIVTPETENVESSKDETSSDVIEEELDTITEMLEEGGEGLCNPVIEPNILVTDVAINAPNEFEIAFGGFNEEAGDLFLQFNVVTDPNEEAINYTVNVNGTAIAENIPSPELSPTGGVSVTGDPIMTGSVGGSAIGEDNFFRIFGSTKNNIIQINTASTPFEMNSKGENLIEIIASNDSGLSRVSSNRVRF